MGGAFDAIGDALAIMFWLCVVFVPLGLWKAVELLILLINHISWA